MLSLAVGAVLQQHVDGHWQPLVFSSRGLRPPEKSTVHSAMNFSPPYSLLNIFEGRDFVLFTDHKALVDAPRTTTQRHSPREECHFDFITQFISDIRHISGTHNLAADTLSSVTINAILPRVSITDYDQLAAKETTDSTLPGLQGQQTSLRLEVANSNTSIFCDVSTGTSRSALQSYPVPDRRIEHIHLDLVGPLPMYNGCSYILTAVDRFSRWPEAFPISDITAATVVRAFIAGWVSCYDTPAVITTDRG
ncbi:uncharacterized protein LOC122255959 [Penaeus japonicus]|uniref:uncharacterized protein LOC122255959 n=1 Tax=Penaeus japonicus TaxID=27405 RepID=UPI001C70E3EC|nr:uncharacterized protein LOC122255959 [Penaeus japonicus]